jgi:hypothetical protein
MLFFCCFEHKSNKKSTAGVDANKTSAQNGTHQDADAA